MSKAALPSGDHRVTSLVERPVEVDQLGILREVGGELGGVAAVPSLDHPGGDGAQSFNRGFHVVTFP